MLLERTISQLAVGPLPHAKARQLAQLGYMQWIAGLPGRADYQRAALHAYETAMPHAAASPAVAEFCDLLMQSVAEPLTPLPLAMPPRKRRGGADARRSDRVALKGMSRSLKR
ncbi:MAG: hypothetical protein AAGF86_09040 [Pseudomonadota bacterium]